MPDEVTPLDDPGLPAAAVRARTGPLPAAPARNRELKPALYQNPLRPVTEPRSLFGEILDWMLAPLLLLWPMSVTVTYLVAQSIANVPYDRHLADAVNLLANHVRESRGEVTLQLPISAQDVLSDDGIDLVYYMVLGLRGELVAGEVDLPLPPDDEPKATRDVKLRFHRLRGNELRLGHTWVEFKQSDGPRYALVQVAETMEKRSQLANEIIRGVIVPQFVVLPIAVVLVWFGLSRGLAPLAALQARIRARRPDDLSPIDPRAAPEEISPVVGSFNELLERLAQNIRTQKRFLADAAHQMKTPLAGLRTQAEVALRETDPHELKRSLRQIAISTERATHLINQLLSLARAEHQAADPAGFGVLDLAVLARSSVQDAVGEAIKRGLDLGFEGPDKPVRVVGTPVLLREMLKNLIDNALHYTPRAGTITVRVRPAEKAVYLEVEDSGPGIPEGERERVFDRFYRILGTNVDGSGLGLAIVREIAAQHGALLRVSYNPKSDDPDLPGTLVSVEFPGLDVDDPEVNLDKLQ
jgi:two-component system, OmpR family, sensor histidine kinase TctE